MECVSLLRVILREVAGRVEMWNIKILVEFRGCRIIMAIVIIFTVHLSVIKETISGAINNVNGRLQCQVPGNIARAADEV